MKRIHQINDRRRALKLRKRSQFNIVFCKSCFLVLRKGQRCRFCELDVLPSLRPYQIEILKALDEKRVFTFHPQRTDLGKSVLFPHA